MAVITLAEAKVFLQITDTSRDALITALIPEIEAHIKEYCNVDFADPWPAGLKLISSKMIGYTMAETAGGGSSVGLQSERQGEYAYTRGTTDGAYPVSILNSLDKYKVSRVHFSTVQTQPRDRRGMTDSQLANDLYVNNVDGVPYEDS
jgi:hypothetical protein